MSKFDAYLKTGGLPGSRNYEKGKQSTIDSDDDDDGGRQEERSTTKRKSVNDVRSDDDEVQAVVKKKRRRRPKFGEKNMFAPNGVKLVLEQFPKIKFKGKGYEKQDIRRLMRAYEEWMFSMNTHLPIENMVSKIENMHKSRRIGALLAHYRSHVHNRKVNVQKAYDELPRMNTNNVLPHEEESGNESNSDYANRELPVPIVSSQVPPSTVEPENAQQTFVDMLDDAGLDEELANFDFDAVVSQRNTEKSSSSLPPQIVESGSNSQGDVMDETVKPQVVDILSQEVPVADNTEDKEAEVEEEQTPPPASSTTPPPPLIQQE